MLRPAEIENPLFAWILRIIRTRGMMKIQNSTDFKDPSKGRRPKLSDLLIRSCDDFFHTHISKAPSRKITSMNQLTRI